MAIVEYSSPFRMMDQFFNQFASDVRSMPMDVRRDSDKFTVTMDLPGVEPGSIDIDVDDRVLTVHAERKSDDVSHDDEKSGWVSRERTYGSYERRLSLDSGLDLDAISADYTDGVLTVTVPIAEQAKPHKIQVTQGTHTVLPAEGTEAPAEGATEEKVAQPA